VFDAASFNTFLATWTNSFLWDLFGSIFIGKMGVAMSLGEILALSQTLVSALPQVKGNGPRYLTLSLAPRRHRHIARARPNFFDTEDIELRDLDVTGWDCAKLLLWNSNQ
jgi:hypothetical protein